MSLRARFLAIRDTRLFQGLVFAIGVLLIVVTPLVSALPGPGGIFVFAAGLTLILRSSLWAKRHASTTRFPARAWRSRRSIPAPPRWRPPHPPLPPRSIDFVGRLAYRAPRQCGCPRWGGPFYSTSQGNER